MLEVGAGIGERYKTQALGCTPEFLFQALKIANDCDIDYRLSKNKRLLVELALIRLCQLTDEKKKSINDDERPAPIQKISVDVPADNISTPVATAPTPTPAVTISQPVKTAAAAEPRPSFQRPGSISITAPIVVNTTQTSETGEVKVEARVIQNKPFTEDELEIAWRRFADTIPEQTRLTSFILSNRPNLLSEKTFEITVNNNSQEKEFNRLKPDIVVFLRNQLQNSSISMNIKMVEETERTRGTSPEDRFRLMTEQNPALAKLRDGLNLEID